MHIIRNTTVAITVIVITDTIIMAILYPKESLIISCKRNISLKNKNIFTIQSFSC